MSGSSERVASEGPVSEALELRVIEPWSRWRLADLRELWEARGLLGMLTARDLKVRYKQTLLGVAWVVLQPLATVLVFTLFLGRFGGLDRITAGAPYPLFALCALLPWQVVARALTSSGESMIANQALITKVYFPRLIVPLAPVGAALVDLAVGTLVLVALMVAYGWLPGWQVALAPAAVAFAALVAAGVAVWVSALNALYRDVRHVVPFLLQLWLFASPVAYATSLVPERWRALYGLNPVVGVVEAARWVWLGTTPDLPAMLTSAAVALALLASGLAFFRRAERVIADTI